MKNYEDLTEILGFTISYVRKMAAFPYPGVKLFTDEQVQHLIEIREEMNAGLSWKELKARYAAPDKTEPKDEPVSDSAIQQTTQENVRELKHEIRGVTNRVMGSIVAKDAIDFTRNLPHFTLSANLQAVKHDELMTESLDVIYGEIDSEPQGNYSNSIKMAASLVDSAYEQGKRITGTTSHGDFAALEAAEKKDKE